MGGHAKELHKSVGVRFQLFVGIASIVFRNQFVAFGSHQAKSNTRNAKLRRVLNAVVIKIVPDSYLYAVWLDKTNVEVFEHSTRKLSKVKGIRKTIVSKIGVDLAVTASVVDSPFQSPRFVEDLGPKACTFRDVGKHGIPVFVRHHLLTTVALANLFDAAAFSFTLALIETAVTFLDEAELDTRDS